MIVLSFPPAVLAGHARGKGDWKRFAATQKWRALVKDAAGAQPLPELCNAPAYTPEGDIALTVRFYPPNKRGDRVNFPNRCKPIFDGLADAWGVNDARFVPHFEFHAPEAPGRVEVEIHPVGETDMTKPIDVGGGYDRLAEAMEAEGVYQIRRHRTLQMFTVTMQDGRIGGGRTIRAAIEAAKRDTLCNTQVAA